MVKTLPFHCWGRRLDPWVGELRSHMPCSAEVGVGAKKKKKRPASDLSSSFLLLQRNENRPLQGTTLHWGDISSILQWPRLMGPQMLAPSPNVRTSQVAQ